MLNEQPNSYNKIEKRAVSCSIYPKPISMTIFKPLQNIDSNYYSFPKNEIITLLVLQCMDNPNLSTGTQDFEMLLKYDEKLPKSTEILVVQIQRLIGLYPISFFDSKDQK